MPGVMKPLFGTPLNRDHPLSNGLVAAYLFNEGTGKFAWDATGNGNDGVLTNMADPPTATSGWGPGPHGGALVFNGTTQGVTIQRSLVLEPPNLSIVTWVKQTTVISIDRIVAKWSNTPPKGYIITVDSGVPVFYISNGSVNTGATSSVSLSLGVWTSLIGTYDGITNRIYFNGLEKGSNTPGTVSYGVTDRLGIGCDFNVAPGGSTPTRCFNGIIALVFIYNRALSADEVAYLYAFPYCMFEEESYPAWMIAQFKSDWLVMARRHVRR